MWCKNNFIVLRTLVDTVEKLGWEEKRKEEKKKNIYKLWNRTQTFIVNRNWETINERVIIVNGIIEHIVLIINSVSFVCFFVFLIMLALVPLSLSLARADIHIHVMYARSTI